MPHRPHVRYALFLSVILLLGVRATEAQQARYPVQFEAQDSLTLSLKEGEKTATLFRGVKLTYGEVSITAPRVRLNMEKDELFAEGPSADTGRTAWPTFQSKDVTLRGRTFAYNLRTRKGRVVGARSRVEDGYILAEVLKQASDSVLYAKNAAYTTCDRLDDPHYRLQTNRIKILNRQWVFTGPVHLRIYNVPLPIWLPFGFFPAREGRRSGPLAPNYGEDERGFYLKDWGWYWAINDYMDVQLRMGIWTLGSWEITPLYRYNRRYAYSGQLQLSLVRNVRGEREDPDYTVIHSRSLRWSHSQTLDPQTTLAASVDLSSASYLRTISERYTDRVRQNIGSSIRLNRRWSSAGRSLSISLLQQQTLSTGQVNLTLPTIRFSQQTRYPFRRKGTSSRRWYENISYRYTASLDNRFDFRPDTTLARGISWWEALLSQEKYEQATGNNERFRFKASHQLPISANVALTRFLGKSMRLNVSSSLNYREDWYLYTTRRFLNEEGKVATRRVAGFTPIRQFHINLSANTEIYGIFPWHMGPFRGFRHIVRPTLSFNLRPDFSRPFWGYYRSHTDATGREIRYPIAPGIPSGRQQTLALSISNVFQGREVRIDSTGREQKKVHQLLTFNISTAYNFAADSLRLSPLSLSARTRLFDQIDFNLSGSFSPYAQDARGRTQNRIAPYLLRLTSLNMTFITSFRSKKARVGRPVSESMARFNPAPEGMSADPFEGTYFNSPVGYADFDIPWSLNLDFTYSLSRFGLRTNRRVILNSAFDVNLTPNLKIQGRTGYDFIRKELATTSISIYRDLHCWEMSFQWIPFGRYQSYQFQLRVKSGHLRDILRLNLPKADIKGRFSNLLR